jgi:serine protease Do
VEVLSSNDSLTTSEIAINADSIVMLECTNDAGTSLGSGVTIGTNGIIVTNYHVIEGSDKINITFNDGSNYTGSVYVYDYDSELDLAVLKISKTGLKSVTIGDSQSLVVGEQVVAIGSPYGFFNTVTEGIVSSIRTGLLQISAAISPGSSGGGLFNSKGELIGITSSGVLEAENLGFAIPIDLLQNVSGRNNMSLTTFSSLTSASDQITQKINPPINIRLVNETYDKAFINWDPVDEADYYYFYFQFQ